MNKHVAAGTCRFPVLLIAVALITHPTLGQTTEQRVVPLGKGSYADSPNLKDPKFAQKYEKSPFIHPSQEGRPVPTNDWWTDLLMQGPGGRLWANPALVRFDDYGVQVSCPTSWNTGRGEKGSGVNTSTPLEVRFVGAPAVIPKPVKGSVSPGSLKTSVVNWGDWTVVARQETAQAHWDVTFGHGLPFVWVECAGLQPSLRGKSVEVRDLKGEAALAAGKSEAFVVKVDGQSYGIYGPEGMSFVPTAEAVDIQFPTPSKGWLAVGVLSDPGMATLLKPAAGAIPRDSLYTWKSDPAKGTVATTFELKTEALRKDAGKPLQGWIPHHFHTVRNTLKKVGTPYVSPRGPLFLAEGSVFTLEYAMPGILPFYPIPKVVGSEKPPYSPERMSGFLKGMDDARTAKGPAGDTYFGGKDIMKVAQFASIADRSKDPSAAALKAKLRGYLEDWFTYGGPGDKSYFASYPKWKGLTGFPTSFGSEFFTDHHFHYGYFTQSAALCGTMDPEFLKDFGPMARLVAKEYANWDRNDKSFPYLRTFDPWNGHSYAGGSGAGDGNNYYAWKGDKENSTWQPAYGRPLISILGDNGGAWATFFSGSAHHIMGIQWLPISPSLYYLGRDPEFVRYQYNACLQWMARDSKPATLLSIGQDWANVLQGFLQFGDPAAVCQQMDDPANVPIDQKENAGLAYLMAHDGVQLGTPAWDYSTTVPTSTVFRNGQQITAVIWNANREAVEARIMHDEKTVKTISVAPRSLQTVVVP